MFNRLIALLKSGDQQHAQVEVRTRRNGAVRKTGGLAVADGLLQQGLGLIEVQVVKRVERHLVELRHLGSRVLGVCRPGAAGQNNDDHTPHDAQVFGDGRERRYVSGGQRGVAERHRREVQTAKRATGNEAIKGYHRFIFLCSARRLF